MRRISYNYLKPQHYYNRLFTFFSLISISLTFALVGFVIDDVELFILKTFLVFFLLIMFAVLIEFYTRGEYMSPLEVYDIENFYNNLASDYGSTRFEHKHYFNKYDHKSKKKFFETFHGKDNYILSSIKKEGEVYTLSVIDIRKMLLFQFFRFLIRKAIHKVHVKKFKHSYKVIGIE